MLRLVLASGLTSESASSSGLGIVYIIDRENGEKLVNLSLTQKELESLIFISLCWFRYL